MQEHSHSSTAGVLSQSIDACLSTNLDSKSYPVTQVRDFAEHFLYLAFVHGQLNALCLTSSNTSLLEPEDLNIKLPTVLTLRKEAMSFG